MTDTSTRPQDLLLQYVEGLAKDFYAERADHERIARAITIIQSGKMSILEDGSALVGSQSNPAQVYTVNGSCGCHDYRRAHGGRCKHRFAVSMFKRLQIYYNSSYYA